MEIALALYEGGLTLQQVGDRFGVTRERIRQLIPDAPRRRLAAVEKQRAYELQAGRLFGGIAAAVGSMHGTVNRYQHGGCRCERCKAANNGRMRDTDRQRRIRNGAPRNGFVRTDHANVPLEATSYRVAWCPYCGSDEVIDRTDQPWVRCLDCLRRSVNPRYEDTASTELLPDAA